MRNSDPLVWDQRPAEHNATAGDDDRRAAKRSLREQVWSGLGSWWVTAFVVLLSAIEAFIVIALALFDLSFIQEPQDARMLAAERNVSCRLLVAGPANAISLLPVPGTTREPSSAVDVGETGTSSSEFPDQMLVRAALGSMSLIIGALFIIEMVLKLVAGGNRFYTDFVEMADCVVVLTVACLGTLFWMHPPLAARGWRLLQLIILFRLLRCARLVTLLVEVRTRVLCTQLVELQRERHTAENKSEVLILKVEDLEHEVAYLKEKLKKTEREFVSSGLGSDGRKSTGGGGGHRKLRDTFSLTSYCGSVIALAAAPAGPSPMGSIVGDVSIPTFSDVSGATPHPGTAGVPTSAGTGSGFDQASAITAGSMIPNRVGLSASQRLSGGLGTGAQAVSCVGSRGNISHSVQTQTRGKICETCGIPQDIDFMAARLSYLALKQAISAFQVQSHIQNSGISDNNKQSTSGTAIAGSGFGTTSSVGGCAASVGGSHLTTILARGTSNGVGGMGSGAGLNPIPVTTNAISSCADVTGAQNTLSARRHPARLLPVPLSVATSLVSPGLSSIESGYSSCLSSASRHPHLSSASPYGSLGESMPASWSAGVCGGSATLCCHSSLSRRGSRGTVFLFPDLQRRTDSLESQGTISVELNILDEVAEAELSPAPTTLQSP
ncbi:uncharacterized protein LOC111253289 [Varroa destructor]|uniref:Voltage-gated hydrogen channel 1 n=1 Tax=Varroa destructor TaxID=109461 RepID=A0A7M7KKN3_VARDE|nr:uncharacterized protein LOC111253289 [Varroa destructor]